MTLPRLCTQKARFNRISRRPALAVSSVLTLSLFGALSFGSIAAGHAETTRPAVKRAAANSLPAPMAVYWKFTGNLFPNNPAAPVLSDDTAYFSMGNRIYAVDLKTGAQKWRYPTDTFLSTYMQTSPVLHDGKLYFGAGDGLYAVDATTGKILWHYFLKGSVSISPIIFGSNVYFSADNGRFYAIDAKTGEAAKGIWSQGGKPGVELGTPIVADAAVNGDTMFYVTSDSSLQAASLSTGSRRWATRIGGDLRMSPVLNGESLYLVFDNLLACYRQSNGQRRWVVPLASAAVAPPAIDADGTAYVATVDRTIYAVDVRGRAVWRNVPQVDYEVFTAPIVTGNTLVVGTAHGNVSAFNTANGSLLWNYTIKPSGLDSENIPTSTNITASPVAQNSTLYVLTDDGTLTAFRSDAIDALPPTITPIEPTQGDYLNGRPPFRIAARLSDDGSGINRDTITLKLDGTSLRRRPNNVEITDQAGFYYNPDDDVIEFNTIETDAGRSNALTDGHHTISISVKDWKGNATTKSWIFYTDDTIKKRSRTTRNGNRRGPGGPGGQGGAGGGGGKGG